MTATQRAVVDDLGNINVHGRSALEIVWKVKDAAGSFINISASDLFVEIATKLRVALVAGEDNYSRKLTLTRAQIATLPLNQPLDYALHDETPSSPATIWNGKITAYGFRAAPSGAAAVDPGTASWTGATVTVQQGESVPTVVVTYMGATGYGVPTGGTSGQYLRKNSATEFDWGFDTITSADVSGLDAQLAAKQPLDADLTTIAANITAAGHALIDDANAEAQRTTMGVAIGTNVQAYSAQLATLAAFDGVFYANPDTIDPTGASDVTALLAALLSTAGANAVVHLHPGATYLISAGLTTATGQRIIGNGATLKRRNQIVTTTTTAMTSGVTTVVTLADATGLAVGMQVAFAQQGVARGALVYASTVGDVRTISAKSGNQITLSAAVNINVSIGGTCFLAFTSLTLGDGASMERVHFDGNRSNWTYSRWETTGEAGATSGGTNRDFINCKFLDAPGEGIMPYGGKLRIVGCRFDNIGGNPIHLSSGDGVEIIGNRAYNGNIDPDVGHGDGFVTLSNSNNRVLVMGNHAEACIAGVGSIDDTDGNVSVIGNDFKNMYCAGVFGGAGAGGFIIANNRIDGCATDPTKRPSMPYFGGIVLIAVTGDNAVVTGNIVTSVTAGATNFAFAVSQASGSTDTKITDNIFLGKVELASAVDMLFSGNTVTGNLAIALATRLMVLNNSITVAGSNVISLSGTGAYEDVTIAGNAITGGGYGIAFSASGSTTYKNIRVSDNAFFNQAARGLNLQSGPTVTDGFLIHANTFRVGSGSATDYLGIVISLNKVTVSDNTFANSIGSSSRVAIYASGATMGETLIVNNVVRDAWSNDLLLTANSGIYAIGNMLKTRASTPTTGNNISTEIVF
jgi:hypothetical protein